MQSNINQIYVYTQDTIKATNVTWEGQTMISVTWWDMHDEDHINDIKRMTGSGIKVKVLSSPLLWTGSCWQSLSRWPLVLRPWRRRDRCRLSRMSLRSEVTTETLYHPREHHPETNTTWGQIHTCQPRWARLTAEWHLYRLSWADLLLQPHWPSADGCTSVTPPYGLLVFLLLLLLLLLLLHLPLTVRRLFECWQVLLLRTEQTIVHQSGK